MYQIIKGFNKENKAFIFLVFLLDFTLIVYDFIAISKLVGSVFK